MAADTAALSKIVTDARAEIIPFGTPDVKHCEPLLTALTDFCQKTSPFFDYYGTDEPLTCYFCEGVYDA